MSLLHAVYTWNSAESIFTGKLSHLSLLKVKYWYTPLGSKLVAQANLDLKFKVFGFKRWKYICVVFAKLLGCFRLQQFLQLVKVIYS